MQSFSRLISQDLFGLLFESLALLLPTQTRKKFPRPLTLIRLDTFILALAPTGDHASIGKVSGMVHNEAASTAFASLGAVCWSVQLIPQIYLNHRRRCTDGFSGLMMILWVSAGVPLGIYNITQNLNIGLQIQPQLFMFFAVICTVQTYHYRLKFSYRKSFILIALTMVLLAALETAGIELLRLGLRNGVHWPVTFIGVISAVLINVGLLPQYWEIYKRNAVIGVSYIFLSIDCAGAVFSFLSLPFGGWDILAAISYGILIIEELGIFVLGLAFWMRDKEGRRVGHPSSGDESTIGENSVARILESQDGATVEKANEKAVPSQSANDVLDNVQI